MRPSLVTIKEAAKLCGVQPVTVRRWVATGKIGRKAGGRIDSEELLRFWDSRWDTPMVSLAFRRWDRIACAAGAKSALKETPAPASTGPGRGRSIEEIDVSDYSLLSACTVQSTTGDFCRAISLDDSPFPICAEHSEQLFQYEAHNHGLASITRDAIIESWNTPERQAINARRDAIRAKAITDASQVYYARLGSGRIKIGYSTNIKQRMSGMRVPLADVLATEPGGRELEQQRHAQFAQFRIGRLEEFEPDIILLAHAQRVFNQHGVTITTWSGRTVDQTA